MMDNLLYNQKEVTVGTADAVVLGGNMRRRRITFAPNGGNAIFVNFGRTALDAAGSGTGFQIDTNKQPLTIDNPPTSEIHAVASVANSIMTIHEWFDK